MEAQLELMKSELYSTNGKLEMANAKLSKLSITDGLTGIYNRRHFDEFLKVEWGRCMRRSIPISLILIDIDFLSSLTTHTVILSAMTVLKQWHRHWTNRRTELLIW